MPDDAFRERLTRNMEEQADVLARLAVPDQPVVSDGCGVAVWRCRRCSELVGVNVWLLSPDVPCPFQHDEGTRAVDPGKWFPTDAQALAEMRAACDVEIGTVALKTNYGYVPVDEVRDAVLRVMFGDAARSPA